MNSWVRPSSRPTPTTSRLASVRAWKGVACWKRPAAHDGADERRGRGPLLFDDGGGRRHRQSSLEENVMNRLSCLLLAIPALLSAQRPDTLLSALKEPGVGGFAPFVPAAPGHPVLLKPDRVF